MKTCILTIVSANYLSYAKALSDSIKENTYDIDFKVLVVEKRSQEISNIAKTYCLDIIFAEDLNLEKFNRIAYKYDIVELNTALKPSCIKYLLNTGYEAVAYLDPDIQVFSDLSLIFNYLKEENHSILLTPHTIVPIMDGKRPSDVDFLRNGTFNLGFIAVKESKQTRLMLDWWEDRCLNLGFNDPSLGIFVDQKWIELIPCYFEGVKIIKHPGCNVAYWNLHERSLSFINNKYIVNGEELQFFHFSGVNKDLPNKLSKHQTRYEIFPNKIIEELVASYCSKLISITKEAPHFPSYSFDKLDDGTKITRNMRRAICQQKTDNENPFNSKSELQKNLKKKGFHCNVQQKNTSTTNFNKNSFLVKLTNTVIRVAVKLIGVEKFYLLIQYFALLSREDHYPSVILKRELNFKHGSCK